jgi:hypothetical protein
MKFVEKLMMVGHTYSLIFVDVLMRLILKHDPKRICGDALSLLSLKKHPQENTIFQYPQNIKSMHLESKIMLGVSPLTFF